MLNITLGVNQKVTIHANPQDSQGNAAALPGTVTWTSDVQIAPNSSISGPGGVDFTFVPNQEGTEVLTATDGDVSAQVTLTVSAAVAGPFAQFGLRADAPVAQ